MSPTGSRRLECQYLLGGPQAWVCLVVGLALITEPCAGVCTRTPNTAGHVDFPNLSSVPNEAFRLCQEITTITLPDTVLSIDESAFSLSTLVTIAIPDSATIIRFSAFSSAVLLHTVTLGNAVTEIATSAFEQCARLQAITFPPAMRRLQTRAFFACAALAAVNLGNVSAVGLGAFRYCTGLISVAIPATVQTIGDYAFAGAYSLASVDLAPNAVLGSSVFTNCLGYGLLFRNTALNNPRGIIACVPCPGTVTALVIPPGVAEIGDEAYRGCPNISGVAMPARVRAIGNFSFMGCQSLETVLLSTSIIEVGSSAFRNCSALTVVSLPDSVVTIRQSAFSHCRGLRSIYIPDSVTAIESEAFAQCTALQTFRIPTVAATIAADAFAVCPCSASMYAAGADVCDCVSCSTTLAPTSTPTAAPPTASPLSPTVPAVTRNPTPAPTLAAPSDAPTSAPIARPSAAPAPAVPTFTGVVSGGGAPTLHAPTATPSTSVLGDDGGGDGFGVSMLLIWMIVAVVLMCALCGCLAAGWRKANRTGVQLERGDCMGHTATMFVNPLHSTILIEPTTVQPHAHGDIIAGPCTNPVDADDRGTSSTFMPGRALSALDAELYVAPRQDHHLQSTSSDSILATYSEASDGADTYALFLATGGTVPRSAADPGYAILAASTPDYALFRSQENGTTGETGAMYSTPIQLQARP
eukprot:m.329801 g.329801  ORF g.329801 m.329801 type:complete len:697 (-) comp27714_c0_seq1:161-2251(-)